jgi:thymidylate synthase (FAD)
MIESAGRTCYKSEDKITPESAMTFVKMLIDRGHYAMLEHASQSYKIICDRGTSHMIVRHRLFSYAQESTQYCNYGKQGGITVIRPIGLEDDELSESQWRTTMLQCEQLYLSMIQRGAKPDIARSCLPTCLKTELVMTGNFTEWRHFFKMRCAKNDQLMMQHIANMLLNDACTRVPIVFDEYKRETL